MSSKAPSCSPALPACPQILTHHLPLGTFFLQRLLDTAHGLRWLRVIHPCWMTEVRICPAFKPSLRHLVRVARVSWSWCRLLRPNCCPCYSMSNWNSCGLDKYILICDEEKPIPSYCLPKAVTCLVTFSLSLLAWSQITERKYPGHVSKFHFITENTF